MPVMGDDYIWDAAFHCSPTNGRVDEFSNSKYVNIRVRLQV